MPAPPPPPDEREALRQRVLYALLTPALRLGFRFRVSLRALGQLVQMGAYHETRRQGLKTHEVAELLEVSARKVALLSSQLKQNFLDAEQAHGLPRRVEFMLWAQPLSAARIKQVLPGEDAADVDAALASLLQQGRVRLEAQGRNEVYVVSKARSRLVDPEWGARLDGLQTLMDTVTNAVYARFFRGDPAAFARTLNLRVRDADLPKLTALYQDVIWPALVALDEAAQGDDTARAMDLSLLWAPYEYLRNADPEED